MTRLWILVVASATTLCCSFTPRPFVLQQRLHSKGAVAAQRIPKILLRESSDGNSNDMAGQEKEEKEEKGAGELGFTPAAAAAAAEEPPAVIEEVDVVGIDQWVQENQVLAAVPILLGSVLLVAVAGAIAGAVFPAGPDGVAGGGLVPSNIAAVALPSFPSNPVAAAGGAASSIASSTFDPRNFQPVCGVSDAVYRTLQGTALSVVGQKNYEDYAPLIAGGILRVRLELCVLESFVYEAVLPFVREKGLSWVLPLHETVETFLAGTVFAVATNFILLGSTKIVAVLVAYTDLVLGLPARLIGGLGWNLSYRQLVGKEAADQSKKDRDPAMAQLQKVAGVSAGVGKSPFLVIFGVSTLLRLVGAVAKNGRQALELLDTFVGRYLVYTTVGYVALKFLHFKVFPDFPF